MANPKHQAYLEQKKKELERRNFDLCERFKQGASDWEIAEEFNFPNQSFFGKYVKSYLGMSPARYRNTKEE